MAASVSSILRFRNIGILQYRDTPSTSKDPPFCHRYCAGDDTIADGPGRSCRDAPPSMAPLRSSQYFRVLAFGRFDEILYLVEKASVLTRPDLQSCGWRSE